MGGTKDNKALFHHFGRGTWESDLRPSGKREAKRLTNLSGAATMTRTTFLSSLTVPPATAGGSPSALRSARQRHRLHL